MTQELISVLTWMFECIKPCHVHGHSFVQQKPRDTLLCSSMLWLAECSSLARQPWRHTLPTPASRVADTALGEGQWALEIWIHVMVGKKGDKYGLILTSDPIIFIGPITHLDFKYFNTNIVEKSLKQFFLLLILLTPYPTWRYITVFSEFWHNATLLS